MALSSKGNFKIAGVEYKAKSLSVDNESLATEDSGRTDDGVIHINWVKSCLRKIKIEMPPSTADLVSQLLYQVQGKIYEITYFDPLTNQERTSKCYTSNSSADCYSGVLYNGLYQGISFNAIETGE